MQNVKQYLTIFNLCRLTPYGAHQVPNIRSDIHIAYCVWLTLESLNVTNA